MAIPNRGLQHIHTVGEKFTGTAVPYRIYMKISCLEMEKARRLKEKVCAMERVQGINNRFKEIEKEKTALLQSLGNHERRKYAKIVKRKSLAAALSGKPSFNLKY